MGVKMGVNAAYEQMRARFEALGRVDLVPKLAAAFAPLVGAERELTFVETATGELLPRLAAGVRERGADDVRALLAGCHDRRDPLSASELARLAHAVATSQTKDRVVAGWLLRIFYASNRSTPAVLALEGQTGGDAFFGVTLGRWFEHGLPVVRLDARLAASLIFTTVDPGIDQEEPPWPAFRIDVPTGLVPCPRKSDDAHVAAVYVASSRASDRALRWDWTVQDTARPRPQLLSSTTADGLETTALTEDFEAVLLGDAWSRPDALTERLSNVVVRLIRGVLATLQDAKHLARTRPRKGAARWRLTTAPQTTGYVLGRDIRVDIDCRSVVGAFVRGRCRGMPAVQWPVRGHWRNQACGPGLQDRRPTWIQPHWKGPEHAARLVRSHAFARAGKASD